MAETNEELTLGFENTQPNENNNDDEQKEPTVDNNQGDIQKDNDEDVNQQDTQINDTQEQSVEEDEYDIEGIYNYLKDNGIAPELPENVELKSINDIANYIAQNQQQIIEQRIQEELNNYPEPYRDLFDYVRNGGDIETFIQNYRNTYSDIKATDLTNNISLQKKVVRDYYKVTTQWTDDMIEKHLNKFSDDEISDLSRNSLEQLKQIEYQQKEQLKKQQEEQQRQIEEYRNNLIQEYKKQLSSLNKIGDIEISTQDKRVIEENLFADKTYYKIMDNFDKYRLQLAILDAYGILDDVNKLSDVLKGKGSSKKYNFKKKSSKKSQTNNDIDFDLILPEKSDNQSLNLIV